MISSLLIKPAGADCNLACSYCFYQPAGRLYPETPHPRMSVEVLRELVRQYMELAWEENSSPAPSPSLHSGEGNGDGRGTAGGAQVPALQSTAAFCWQGGEPTLMGLDFYRTVVALQQKHGHPGQVVANSLQTNGLLLNEDWARFLYRYRFLVGLSLDGPPEIHDAHRLSHGGEGSQRQVLRAYRTLQKAHVDTNFLCMVTSLSAPQPERLFEYLTSLGASFLQFIPCLERHPRTGELLPFTVTAEQYGDFLTALFDLWLPHREEVSIRLFDDVVSRLLGCEEAVSCAFRPRCGDYFVIEHNGDAYACDFFVDPDHLLGNLLQTPLSQLAAGEALATFAAAKEQREDGCGGCEWLTFCQGGCPRHRLFGSGSVHGRDYLCAAYQRFFAYALPPLREIAQQLADRQEE